MEQIVESGKATTKFLHYIRLMLGIGVGCLLLAMVGDTFLAARVIGLPNPAAGLCAAAVFVVGVSLWHVFALLRREDEVK
jgi:hypothetical protein